MQHTGSLSIFQEIKISVYGDFSSKIPHTNKRKRSAESNEYLQETNLTINFSVWMGLSGSHLIVFGTLFFEKIKQFFYEGNLNGNTNLEIFNEEILPHSV